jgi:hypothetical protein
MGSTVVEPEQVIVVLAKAIKVVSDKISVSNNIFLFIFSPIGL